jgi:hypothetical protein
LILRRREFDDSKRESTLHFILSPLPMLKWPKEAFFQHPCLFLNIVNSLIHSRSRYSKQQSSMNLVQTLELLRQKEKQSGSSLESALSRMRYRKWSDLPILSGSDAFYLPAVNTKARIKWGHEFIRQVRQFFSLEDGDDGLIEPVFLVTLAEKSGLTADQAQSINLSRMKRKLAAGMVELSYIGMIEPGYYNNIYSDAGKQRKNVISWHGHFLVWGVTEKDLNGTLIK